MEKILILGINGFTGRHFQKYIEEKGLTKKYIFAGVDRKIEKHSSIRYIKADLLKKNALEKIVLKIKPDYIINFAGILKADEPAKAIEINAGLTLKILDLIAKNKLKVKKVLLIGSAAEYGEPKYLPVDEEHPLNPGNYYGLSKVIQTMYAQYYYKRYGIPVNIARTFNISGENLPDCLSVGSFAKQIKKAKNGDTIKVGNLKTIRDYIKIDDAVDFYWKILQKGKAGEVYNVCSGKAVKMEEILNSLIGKFGKKIKVLSDAKRFQANDIKEIVGSCRKLFSRI